MSNLPVHWSEGLFLRPHHFQAADRYWAETLQTSGQWDHQYNYGVRTIEISDDAIANHEFQLNLCHARMKDGTLVSLQPGQTPDRVNLKEVFASESVVQVYLAVPSLKMGVVNVGPEEAAGKHRYIERTFSPQDESSGGNDQEIQFRVLNVRLLLSTQDTQGYELLPIAQVQRASDQEAVPVVDDRFFPPMLAIDAWPPLGRDVVRSIYDIIGKRVELLSEQVINRGISLASQEPGDLDRLLMLSKLNEAYSTLRILTFASGVHPFVAYVELCRIVGQLAIFGPQRRAAEAPVYDHDDLARIFYWVKQQIELLLAGVQDPIYEQRFFLGEGKGMRVSLESKWLEAQWQWFVGVSHGGISREECLNLLCPGELDWKLGSADKVDSLFEFGAEGLQMMPEMQVPRALPPGGDWIYYQVDRQGPAWTDVLQKQTLAMRLKDSLIVNREALRGQRTLVVSVAGKQVTLQFALFAVPSLS